MKLRMPIKMFVLSGFMVALFFSAGVALASYNGPGFFNTNQMYRCHYGAYSVPNQNAAAMWSVTTDLDIYASCTGNNITTVAQNYGANGFAGYAWVCGPLGCNPQSLLATYWSCEAQSNTYYLSTWNNTQRQFNAMHELGHCWSLGHDTRSTSVMQTGQLSVTTPDTTNINEVNYRH